MRLTRIFYVAHMEPWVFFANRLHDVRKRETAFSFYGPLSLIFLLVLWAAGLVFGFALHLCSWAALSMTFEGAGPAIRPLRQRNHDLHLGPGDVGPQTRRARELIILEAGTGFGFLAIVMGYFPVL